MTDKTQEKTDSQWREMQVQLDTWEKSLAELRAKEAIVGADLVTDIERKYLDLRKQHELLRARTEVQLEEAKRETTTEKITQQVQEKMSDASDTLSAAKEATVAKAGEIKEQASETAKNLKKGAGDVGEGFQAAWTDLRQSFEAAMDRLK